MMIIDEHTVSIHTKEQSSQWPVYNADVLYDFIIPCTLQLVTSISLTEVQTSCAMLLFTLYHTVELVNVPRIKDWIITATWINKTPLSLCTVLTQPVRPLLTALGTLLQCVSSVFCSALSVSLPDSDAHSTTSSASPAQSPSYSNHSDEGSDTEVSSGSAPSQAFSFLDLTYWKR